MTKPTKSIILRIAVIVVFGMLLILAAYRSTTIYKDTYKKSIENARQKSKENNTLTLSTFQRVEMGGNVNDAIGILGWGFDQISETKIGNVTTTVFKWEKPDPKDGSVTLTLQNGAIFSKTQEGLK